MSNKTKNSGLGRGLDALFSDSKSTLETMNSPKNENGEYIIQIPISDIDINKDQPRKNFDQESLQELAASIKANGLLQPIAVQKIGDRYTIIAGERRYRAFRLLEENKIPCIIKNLDTQQIMELALVENLQREDLNPLEEASAIEALLKNFNLTQQELSERLGKSRSALANSVRLLQLQPEIKQYVLNNALRAGHARALLALTERNDQLEIGNEVLYKGLNVRQTEELVNARINSKRHLKKYTPNHSELREFEQAVREALGTKVNIVGSPKKGHVSIEYYSQDQLEGLLEFLMQMKK